MTPSEAKRTWADYFERKNAQRIEEATILSAQMVAAGVDESTVLALDFVHFSPSKDDAKALAAQLQENYAMSVSAAKESGYWLISGTTRPYGINLTSGQHVEWVQFMADVAKSHGCVFSTWSIEAPALGKKFNSEEVEGAR